jgi:hypothetical protein
VFLFADFHHTIEQDPGRTWVWEIIHFPLHFAILLLLAAMTNAIRMTAWTEALVQALEMFITAVGELLYHRLLTYAELWKTSKYIDRLDLTLDFVSEYDLLSTILAETTDESVGNSTLITMGNQYVGQIVWSACSVSSHHVKPN